MIQIIKRFIHHPDLIPLVLFTVIFAVYFSSSVGLVNSGDSPQFFTTEALIQYQNIDLKSFRDDPHYFIWPDFISYRGQVLSFRGFTQSVLMIPLHFLAPLLMPFMSSNAFPLSIQSHNFIFELSVVSLFTIISSLAVLLIWKLMVETGCSRTLSFIASILFAFGTFTWKYSAYYARQGVVLFLSAVILLAAWNILNRRGEKWAYAILSICFGLAFGLDTIFCISVGILILILLILRGLDERKRRSKFDMLYMLPGIFILILIVIFDVFWYGNPSPNQYLQSSQFDGIPYSDRMSILTSAPLFPTLYMLLFSFGPPIQSAFSHLANLPQHTLEYSSVFFARQYYFYGLFAVSPFLLLSIFFPFWKMQKKSLLFAGLCLMMFIVNICGAAKFYTFWGGNQYDIRYVYPSAVFLLPLFVFSLQYVYKITGNIIYRAVYTAFFILLSVCSLFMGWLGEINMFAPAITGERKIWMDPLNFPLLYSRVSFDDYVQATFMNRENVLVPILVTSVLYLLLFSARMLYNATRNGKTSNSERKTETRTGHSAPHPKKSRNLHRPI